MMTPTRKILLILLVVTILILSIPSLHIERINTDKKSSTEEIATEFSHKGNPRSVFSLESIKELATRAPSGIEDLETLQITGQVVDVRNRSLPMVGSAVLAFFMRDPVQYNPSLVELMYTIGFNVSYPYNPLTESPSGTFNIQFRMRSIEEHLAKYPYLAYLVFPGSNVTILNIQELFSNQNGSFELNLGEVPTYPFETLGILAVSGISHINRTVPIAEFMQRPNLSSDESQFCAPFTYQAIDPETGDVLLDVPVVFINAFSSIIPFEDFFFWLPVNRTVNVRFIFYTLDIGWVDETWAFNTTYPEGWRFSYHLLTLDVAKKTLQITEERFQELKRKGINLDHYKFHLKSAQLHQQCSLDFWSQATPNITYSGTLQFFDLSEMGYKALVEAEMTIVQAQRAKKLVDLYYDSLSAQPAWISALTTLVLATIISILVAQALTDRMWFSFVIRISIFLTMLGTAYLVNPLLNGYLETETLTFGWLSLPISVVMIGLFLLVGVVSFLLPLPQILDRPRTFLTLSIRNLRRRKSRTLVVFATLGIAITSFVLIVSNNYEVDVLSEGKKADYTFDDGILIENYIYIPLQGAFQYPLTKRVEIVTNVTLQVYEESNTAIAMRYYSTMFEDELEITISSIISQDNWTHQLRNLLAITPTEEERITHLQTRFLKEGNGLVDNSPAVLLSKSLQKKLNITVGETIQFTYNASGTILSLPLNVSGIFNDELGNLCNVNGKAIAPPNYNASRTCNSTEFVIIDFEYWRVQLAKAIAEATVISVSEAPPTQILLGTTNLEVARQLADRLEDQTIVMGKNDIVYSLRVRFFGKTEGVIPQIVPLAISCLVVYQIILNSVWERRKEIRVYGTLGLSDRGVKVLLSAEYIILGAICGGIAYYAGLVLFPVVKAANIESSFLSQKTDATFAFLSVGLAVALCALAAIPAISRAYAEIVPKEESAKQEYLDGALELPVQFDQQDFQWLEQNIRLVPFFKLAKFDSQGEALGQKDTKIVLTIVDDTISGFLHPGDLSKKEIEKVARRWLNLGIMRRNS